MLPIRKSLRAILLLLLAAIGLALGACSEYSFLDDFPPYAPTEPYLEEQHLQRLRVEALRRDEERKKNRYLSESREAALAEWRRLEVIKARGLRRIEMQRAREDRKKNFKGPRNLDEWDRIMH